MSTVIVCWGEETLPPRPLGTITRPSEDGSTRAAVDAAKAWCQAQATILAGGSPPPLEWAHYLSRGTGPGTTHYVASCPDGTFEIWIVGELKS